MKETIQLATLIQHLQAHYPTDLAESWDQVGLHFGHPQATIKNIMTALDIRPELVDEAIQKNIDTIIVHHPPIFHPIRRFNLDDPQNQMYAKLIQHHINVYAMHTNFDAAWNGMNDWLAQALGLTEITDLQQHTPDSRGELPTIGRVGFLPQALNRDALIKLVKDTFVRDFITTVEKSIKEEYNKVAIVGGAGGSMLSQIAENNVDVFITGDVTYHTAQALYDMDILTIDAGHYIEHIFVDKMADLLRQWANQEGWDLNIIPSITTTNAMFIQ